jgi:hypothetical protein
MSEVRVNKLSPRSGTTVTLGDSGDTITIPSGVTFDASSGGLAGTLTTAAQPNITSVGTLTSFASTGIDDNATSTAITIDSSNDIDIGATISSIAATSPQLTISSTGEQLLLQGTTNGTGQSVDILFEQKLTNDNTRAGGKISSIATGSYTAGDGGTYDSALVFYSGTDGANTERMRINQNGNIQIGTTTESARLHIASSTTAGTDPLVVFSDASGTDCGSIDINASGNTVAYTTSSDYRLKENVDYNFDATTRLKQLKPARFNFIADTDTTVDGFLAHEVSSVVPEAITGTHNEVEVWKNGEELPEGVSVGDNKLDENGNTIPVYQGIDQSKLVPLLVKTIQELEARITQLENA